MMLVLVDGATVNEDIVKVDHKELASEGTEDFVHEAHESARSNGETKRHDEPFIKPLARLEGPLPLVTLSDSHLMISIPEIQFGEDSFSGKLVQ